MIKTYIVLVNEITLHATLKACYSEGFGYTTLIFEDLEFTDPDLKYITCTMFPNWEHASMKPGEEGYLNIKHISAGEDKWFDGKEFIPYKYTNIQFLKFVKIKETSDELILY